MNWKFTLVAICIFTLTACGTSKKTTSEPTETSLKESLDNKNRANVSLLNQIRQLPGISLRGGVPAFSKNSGTLTGGTSQEPLYVLDDYVVGNSFRSIDQLVRNIDVKKIETFTGPDASIYGSRGANGVIKITTIK